MSFCCVLFVLSDHFSECNLKEVNNFVEGSVLLHYNVSNNHVV